MKVDETEEAYWESGLFKINTVKILIILSRERLVQPRPTVRVNGSIFRPSLWDSRQDPLYTVCLGLTHQHTRTKAT